MLELKSEFLFDMHVETAAEVMVGQTPLGFRLTANITGGYFEGPSMKGRILPSGGDWLLVRKDGCMSIDVRMLLETDDKVQIYVTYGGRLMIPEELREQMNNPETALKVDPSLYYWRTTMLFETPVKSAYDWMNNIVAIGSGRRGPKGVIYSVHAIR